MKLLTILLRICILILCITPVHALFAGDDIVEGYFCPAGGPMTGNILENDIPGAPSVTPVLVNDAEYGSVDLLSNGKVYYRQYSRYWDSAHASDSFQYRNFDGNVYSNIATVRTFLGGNYAAIDGKSLKFTIPRDTELSAEILDYWNAGFPTWAEYGSPSHGTLIADTSTQYFKYIPDQGFEGTDQLTYSIMVDTGECGDIWGKPGTIEIVVGNPNPVPEFPEIFLPVTFITGFVAAVLLIQRKRIREK